MNVRMPPHFRRIDTLKVVPDRSIRSDFRISMAMRHVLRHTLIVTFLALAAGSVGGGTLAQAPEPDALRIEWEVKSRFRLFRNEADFQRHVAAYRGDGVLAAEERLARASDGRGWARDVLGNLCVDGTGKLLLRCRRDGEQESYLRPQDHRVGVILTGLSEPNATCAWTFDDGEGAPRQASFNCEEDINIRVRYGRTTSARVTATMPDGTTRTAATEIRVRDILIAGLGDSIAAGEGNPERPVALADDGFCFRRFLGGALSEYYRPSRAGFRGSKACEGTATDSGTSADWARQGARWMSAACHRSLYSYQVRTALALAVENPHLAVTLLPLACSGATISDGFLDDQRARECASAAPSGSCSSSVPAQISVLRQLLKQASNGSPDRKLDLILLTIGANDVEFAGLVANVIMEPGAERTLLNRSGMIATADRAKKLLTKSLPGHFARLREALKPLVGGDLARVVFTSYGNPMLTAPGQPCPGGRDGFDVHPAFNADKTRLREGADFVAKDFLPAIRALARCESGVICRDPLRDAMTLVEAHQFAFASHGICARGADDPDFDRACFSSKGESFRNDAAVAATVPLTCGQPASQYRPYAPRRRWIRTANDSYFTAMTYAIGHSSAAQPSDIHDATWGATSAVYGGAIHPTAQGHAAMADAALVAVRALLEVAAPAIISAPLSAPLAPDASPIVTGTFPAPKQQYPASK
jgi:lysophospholipase L1-like esterase